MYLQMYQLPLGTTTFRVAAENVSGAGPVLGIMDFCSRNHQANIYGMICDESLCELVRKVDQSVTMTKTHSQHPSEGLRCTKRPLTLMSLLDVLVLQFHTGTKASKRVIADDAHVIGLGARGACISANRCECSPAGPLIHDLCSTTLDEKAKLLEEDLVKSRRQHAQRLQEELETWRAKHIEEVRRPRDSLRLIDKLSELD